MFKDKNILFIVHNYNSFQKSPIEETAKYFKKVYVLVRYKPLSKYVRWFPIKWLKKYSEEYSIDLKNVPKNVIVIKTPVWYVPYGFINKMLGWLHYRSVRRIIRENNIKFDIVHSHFIWSSGFVGMKIKEEFGVPFVVTGHGYDVYSLPFKSKYWKEKITDILNSADQIITVSGRNKEFLSKLDIEKNKVEIINNGFDSTKFYPVNKTKMRKRLDIPLGSKVCVSVGNLENVKGHDQLIHALNILKDSISQLDCYIVGAGTKEHKLVSLKNDLGLENKIHFVGYKPHEEVYRWINVGDIFVLPSLKEGASVVMLEALACGKPVVATDVGAVSDIITNEDYGLIAKVLDPYDLARQIKKSLERNWDQEKISRYAQKFTWANAVEETLKIYEDLIS